jgi:phytoene synthase
MQFQYDRALTYLDAAALALPAEARKPQRCGLILMALHRALLTEIKADGFQVLQHQLGLTPLRKFWLAWKTWVF